MSIMSYLLGSEEGAISTTLAKQFCIIMLVSNADSIMTELYFVHAEIN